MSARLQLFDKNTSALIYDLKVQSMSIDMSLSQSADWSATIPISEPNLEGFSGIEGGALVKIIWKGRTLLEGTAQTFNKQYNDVPTINIRGRDNIDTLYTLRAYSKAYYENLPILVIIEELLRRADWRIGDISTMVNKDQLFTIDLRGENQLLAQIARVLESIPNTYYRYGGTIAGKKAIDIGSFNQQSDVRLYKAMEDAFVRELDDNTGVINGISVTTTINEIINGIEAIGGEVLDNTGVLRRINLGDALVYDPTLATNPDFPILTEVSGEVWLVRNNAVPTNVGMQTYQEYTNFTPPKKSTPANINKQNASGYALYLKCVKILQDHAGDSNQYKVEVDGGVFDVQVGDRIYIKGDWSVQKFNPFTETTEIIDISLDQNLRVVGVSMNFDDSHISWSFDLLTGSGLKQELGFAAAYRKTAVTKQPPAGEPVAPVFTPDLDTITLTATGGSSDVFLSDGTEAKLFEIPLPGAPVGATEVYLLGLPYGTSVNGTPTIELVSDPVFGISGPIVAVTIGSRPWNPVYSIDLEAKIVWR